MISICIPIYNFNVVELVTELNQQSELLKIPYEILCIDDCSEDKWKTENHGLKEIENVRYYELKSNIGRSRIRNKMAEKANYEWLLFLDSDSQIKNSTFISKYLDCITKYDRKKDTILYYGSTIYSSIKPNRDKILHWKYGNKIESKTKHKNFSTHHFLIRKKNFLENTTQFDESFLSYGYEDVFFIITNKLSPVYIENPVYHIGIKSTTNFIEDTKCALKNLINYTGPIEEIENKIKLLRLSKKINKLYLDHLIIILYRTFKKFILKNLYSKTPSLFLFQFYKLGFFLENKSKKKAN